MFNASAAAVRGDSCFMTQKRGTTMTKPDSDTLERMQERKALARINRRRRRCGKPEIGAEDAKEIHDLEAEQSFSIHLSGLHVQGRSRIAWTIVLCGAATGLIVWLLS